MQSRFLVSGAAFACALLFGSGRALALVREKGLDFSLDIRWMHSDGAGGVFVRNGEGLIRFDSEGRVEHLPLPSLSLQGGSPLSGTFFSTSRGELWSWDRKTRLLRYTRPSGWEEAVVPLPGEGDYECSVATETGEPRLLCIVPDSSGQAVEALATTVAWPTVSPWEKALPPIGNSRIPPDSLWAMDSGNADTLGLFLANGSTRPWRETLFTVGSLSGPPLPGDTIPFPSGWTSPRAAHAGFAKERAALVSQPYRTWIALGELLVMRKGSIWTFFYAKSQSRDPFPHTAGLNRTLSYKLTRAVPYLYTGFLAVSAMQSGPGWEGEAAWAVAGFVPGTLAGGLMTMMWGGYCASPNASRGCGSGSFMIAPLIAVPLTMGIWAVGSHQSEDRRDRTWLRAGTAALGAVSGVGLYFAFPGETRWMYFGAIAGASLGAVAGYRLAWFE